MYTFPLLKQTLNFLFQACSRCTQAFMEKMFVQCLQQLGYIAYVEEKLDLINYSNNKGN